MNWSKLALFVAGIFFGGAIDHLILAAVGSETTPYGVRSGVAGNWALAGLDLAMTGVLYLGHRWLARRRGADPPANR
jgi:hypothetical protein